MLQSSSQDSPCALWAIGTIFALQFRACTSHSIKRGRSCSDNLILKIKQIPAAPSSLH